MKINHSTVSIAMLLFLVACSKPGAQSKEQIPNLVESSVTPSSAPPQIGLFTGTPSAAAMAQKHIDKCKSIKDNNTDVSTLNYELQNSGCTLVDVTTYKK